MADFSLSKPFTGVKKRDASRPGNMAYAVFVLLCFWAGAQLLNLLVHAPGVFERLMQVQDASRPHVRTGVWRRHAVWPRAVPCGKRIVGCHRPFPALAATPLTLILRHTGSPTIVDALRKPCCCQVARDLRAF